MFVVLLLLLLLELFLLPRRDAPCPRTPCGFSAG